MIPKVAHFHWESNPINWLRMHGIYTFARLNPRWKIILHRTPDWMLEKDPRMFYCHQADYVWIDVLHKEGGFAFATDTVFVKPVPDEWLDADMCICSDGSNTFSHNSFGSVAGMELLKLCVDSCEETLARPGDLDYQQFGTLLLQSVVATYGGLDKMREEGYKIFDMPYAALCPIGWANVERCWSTEPLELPDETIGVTWFGGNSMSRKREPECSINDNDAIIQLARSVV